MPILEVGVEWNPERGDSIDSVSMGHEPPLHYTSTSVYHGVIAIRTLFYSPFLIFILCQVNLNIELFFKTYFYIRYFVFFEVATLNIDLTIKIIPFIL